MIVRHRNDLLETAQHVKTKLWSSTRLFIKNDNLGFSLHETIVEGNTEQTLWYKNHIEAVVVTEGTGEIVDLATGETHFLKAGSAYALNGEKHIFRAFERFVCYCVFVPGLNGDEIPDADGSYPAD